MPALFVQVEAYFFERTRLLQSVFPPVSENGSLSPRRRDFSVPDMRNFSFLQHAQSSLYHVIDFSETLVLFPSRLLLSSIQNVGCDMVLDRAGQCYCEGIP